MDARSGDISQRLVHHALPHQAGNASKGRAFNFDGEVGFAGSIIPTMAMMFGAVVDDSKAGWRECCFKQPTS